MTRDRNLNTGIILAAALLPVCTLLASRGVVVLFAVAVAVSAWRLVAAKDWAAFKMDPIVGLLCALLVWALVSLAWTPSPGPGLGKWATVAAILAGALVLRAAARTSGPGIEQAIGPAIVAGVIGGLGLLSAELASGQYLTGSARALFSPGSPALVPEALNQGACVLAISVWPAALILARSGHRILAVLVVVSVFAAVSATVSSAAALSVPVAAVGGAMVWWGGPRAARALGAALAGLCLAAPILPLTLARPALVAPLLPENALPELHRLHLWEFVGENIVQHPVAGSGFFASRFLPGGSTELIPGVPLMALHPHNLALQAWLELGLPGAAILAGLLYMLFSRGVADTVDRATRATLSATLLSALTIAGLSYGMWQSWWLAALGLVAAIALASRGPVKQFPLVE